MLIYVIICKDDAIGQIYTCGHAFKSYQEALKEITERDPEAIIEYDNFGIFDKSNNCHYKIERVFIGD